MTPLSITWKNDGQQEFKEKDDDDNDEEEGAYVGDNAEISRFEFRVHSEFGYTIIQIEDSIL